MGEQPLDQDVGPEKTPEVSAHFSHEQLGAAERRTHPAC